MRDVIEIDEHKAGAISIPGNDAQLVFSNERGLACSSTELTAALASSENCQAVTSVVIRASSHLADLRLLTVLPNVAYLRIHGLRILTLDGVETLKSDDIAVAIDTDRNRKRAITALTQSPITSLELGHTQVSDFETIRELKKLRRLTAGECEVVPTEGPWGAPLESFSLHNGRFVAVGDLRQIPRLTQITLNACRRLVKFTGDNSNIEWLAILSCKQFDMSSLSSFSGLRSLAISKCNVSLATLGGLPSLEEITLDGCEVDVAGDFSKQFKGLRKLSVGRIGIDVAARLSSQIPSASILASGFEYRDGVRVTG